MSYAVVFKEEAQKDISEAYNWYESKLANLGEGFLAELEVYVKTLEREPQIFQIRNANRRYCPLKRFPYLIVYEIEQKEIVVYAVFNTYQHPSRLDIRR